MNINEIHQTATAEAHKLTVEMNVIFAQHPECEAPEFMPEYHLNEWNMLYKIRRGIFDKLTRLEQVAGELNHYLKMEVI